MMNVPAVSVLVHGGPDSIEAIRIRGLTRRHPTEKIQLLFREGGTRKTAIRWRKSVEKFQPDLLYILNTASPGAFLGPLWRITKGVPYILDTGDAVFEMARTSGIGAGWKLPFLWAFERLLHNRASAIVVRGTKHRELLEAQGRQKVIVIRDGFAENQEVSADSVVVLRQQLGLQGRFVVGVMGSTVRSPRLGICYGWDLLEALASLRDLPISGLIIGDGSGLDWLRQRAQELNVSDRIVFTGRIPYQDVPRYLRLMEVALSTQTNNLPGQVRTTGKIPEYMAAGRFIIASRVGEAEMLLPDPMLVEYHGEVDSHYPMRLSQRIREVFASEQLISLGASLPERAERLCSYGVLSQKWSQLVSELNAPS